jgi:hypothetical protein
LTAFETESSWSSQTVQTQETPWARQASTASDLEEESVQETTGSDHELESPFLSSLSFLEAAKGSQLTADPGISATLESPFLSP